jgi:hypothetical protein
LCGDRECEVMVFRFILNLSFAWWLAFITHALLKRRATPFEIYWGSCLSSLFTSYWWSRRNTWFFIWKGVDNQSSYQLTQQNQSIRNARNNENCVCLFATTCDCHPFQDCKDRRCLEWNGKQEKLVHFLQESTGSLHPLLDLQTIWSFKSFPKSSQSTRNYAFLKFTIAKCNTNLIDFYRQWCSFWLNLVNPDIHPTLPMECLINGNSIVLGVAGTVIIVSMIASWIECCPNSHHIFLYYWGCSSCSSTMAFL